MDGSNAEAGPSNGAARSAVAPSASSSRPARPPSPPGGGPAPLIQLRSKAPLPVFTCAHPIPPTSATIGATLKLSVLRLLTGEMTEKSSTAPMTESQSLKLMTLHGWRMEMIALELRQNVLIAPETRDRIGDGADEGMEGFELGDDAECALLEPDDEVLIRLKPAFQLADLHLPKLSSSHVYALPKGALTRAGTLSSPPPYSQHKIKQAAEPSSHSSSVQGQPNVNYNARHRDYTKGYRSITVPSGGGGGGQQVSPNQYFGPTPAEARKARGSTSNPLNGPSRPLGLGSGVEPPAAQPVPSAYRPAALKTRRSSSNQQTTTLVSNQTNQTLASSSKAIPPVAPSPTLPQLPESQPVGLASRPTPTQSGTNTPRAPPLADTPMQSPPQSRPSQVTRKSSASVINAGQPQNFGSGQPAGQESMPLTALVIGPGVQGAVGRGSNALMGHSGPGEGGPSRKASASEEYGNAKAFAGFTAAGGEVRHRPKQRSTSHSSQDGKSKKELRDHVRSRSQQDLLLSTPEGQVLGSPGTDSGDRDDNGVTPAQAAVTAAQRRAAAARAAAVAAANSSDTAVADSEGPSVDAVGGASESPKQRARREKVELPQLPALPPVENLAPFPRSSNEERRESDLPAMPTPADSPDVYPRVKSSRSASTGGPAGTGAGTPPLTQRQLMKRTQSSAAQSRVTNGSGQDGESKTPPAAPAPAAGPSSPSEQRPQNSRQVSSSAPSQNDSETKKKTPGRFARLAAPGLGLGFAPPLARRQNSHGSVLTQRSGKGQEDDAQDVEGEGVGPSSAPGGDLESSAVGEQAEDVDAPAASAPAAKLSRAERRYAEFQKSVAAEVSKQTQAEQQRTSEREARQREEAKKQKKREAAANDRKEKQKWEIWEEVRKRTADEKGRA